MPDNKNPPENDQTQKPKDKEEKISRVGELRKCQYENFECPNWAISLSPYCWEHIEDKEKYRNNLWNWAFAGIRSMERFVLINADLSNIWLWKANLSKAWLWKTNLSKATLLNAKLSDAQLIGADLSEALLINANFNNANLALAKLTGAIGLTKKNFSSKLSKEEKKDADIYKESYITVKNHFIQSGQYDDASWAAFRERTLERIGWYNELTEKGLKKLGFWGCLRTILRWFGSKLMSLLNGYGERPLRVIISSGVIVIFFSFIHYIYKWIQSYPKELLHWWDYLYFSIVTFTTLGYGDIRPLATPGARLIASGEAFIGAFMIALFVWTLARRYVAR